MRCCYWIKTTSVCTRRPWKIQRRKWTRNRSFHLGLVRIFVSGVPISADRARSDLNLDKFVRCAVYIDGSQRKAPYSYRTSSFFPFQIAPGSIVSAKIQTRPAMETGSGRRYGRDKMVILLNEGKSKLRSFAKVFQYTSTAPLKLKLISSSFWAGKLSCTTWICC